MMNVWTSAGPKSYAYQLSNGSTTFKVDGFSLNRSDTAKLIYYNSRKIMTLLKKYTSFMDVIGMVVQNVSKLRRNILKRGK